ncbi:MAG: hypothetical protein M3Y78_00235 [Pseudomonadota bacterium]|nr:hypothetical protein [Pseudomonadota bacterium]
MQIAEYLPQLLLAWSIQAMGILSPGPSVALILGVATSRGRLPSVVTALGVSCGSIVLASRLWPASPRSSPRSPN